MKQVRIKAAIEAGWAATKDHFVLLLAVAVAGAVLQGLLGLAGWPGKALGMLIAAVLGLILQMVYLKAASGEQVTFSSLGELPLTPAKALHWALAAIAIALMVLVGSLFLIVPGVYLLLRFIYAPLAILDQGLGLKAALAESSRLTEGVKGDLALFGLLSLGLMLLGLVACCVGVIPAGMTVGMASAWIYLDLKKQCDERALPA